MTNKSPKPTLRASFGNENGEPARARGSSLVGFVGVYEGHEGVDWAINEAFWGFVGGFHFMGEKIGRLQILVWIV